MARRIATEYKLLELDLNSQQLQEFMKLFTKSDFKTEVRVFENGDTEFILYDEGTEIPLAFRNMGSFFKVEGSYIVKSWKLAHVLQKAVRDYKGHACVHRVYEQHRVEYRYEYGNVILIKEIRGENERIVYQHQNLANKLEALFNQKVVEDQINWTKLQIDMLLEKRLHSNKKTKQEIDAELKLLSNELFYLEA